MILGIDPGVNNIGVAFLDDDAEKVEITHLLTVDKPDSVGYEKFIGDFSILIEGANLSYIGIEKPFFTMQTLGKNTRTLEIIGFMKYVLFSYGYDEKHINIISPATIKKQSTGSGRASKEDVITSMEDRYDLNLSKNSHVADAIACALTAYKLNQ